MASALGDNTQDTSSRSGPADALRQAGHSAVDKALDAAQPATQWFGEKQSYVQDQLKSTTDYVVANPLKAIGIAFAVGVLFGRITG